MTPQERIKRLTAHSPPFLDLLGGEVVTLDADQQICEMHFDISEQLCHSVNVVQGGFVTAMLDAAMTHAVFGFVPDITTVATLEVKVSFLEPSLAGRFRCRGHVQKAGRSLVFLTGELCDDDGVMTATSTSTAKLVRR